MTRGKVLRLFLSVAVVIGFVAWSVGPAVPSDLPPDPVGAFNLHVVGAMDVGICNPPNSNNCTPGQHNQYSKNGNWPLTTIIDGKDIFTSGCYENSIDPAMPGCFRVVDVSDPYNPKRIAEVPVYDPVNSPLPPPPTDASFWGPGPGYNTLHYDINVWKNPKFTGKNCTIYDGNVLGDCEVPFGLEISTACGDWKKESNGQYHAVNAGKAECWDKGWVTRTHYIQGANGEYELPGYGMGSGASGKNKDLYWVNNMLLGGAPNNRPSYTGISFWSLKDPYHPEYLSRIEATVHIDGNGNYSNAIDVGSDGKGVHHGFFDGRYAFTGWTEYGYSAETLTIIDAKDPRHPKLASRWWVPGQKESEMSIRNSHDKYPDGIDIGWKQVRRAQPVTRTPDGLLQMDVFMHYVSVTTIRGRDIAFLSYGGAGLILLDVTDRTNPQFISRVSYNTPEFQEADMSGPIEPTTGLPYVQLDHMMCQETYRNPATWSNPDVNPVEAAAGKIACGNSHSGKIVPGTNGTLYWHTDESSRPAGHLRLFDVSDLKHPKIVGNFFLPPRQYPTPNTNSLTYKVNNIQVYSRNWAALSENFALNSDYKKSTPGTHIGNAYSSDLLFLAWYGAGVVVVDISDPTNPKLAGYYEYIVQDGIGGAGTYDVTFDQRGHVVVNDRNDGVRILEYTGPGSPLYTGHGTTALDFRTNNGEGKDKDKKDK